MNFTVKKAGLLALFVAVGAMNSSSAFATYYDFDNPGAGFPVDVGGQPLIFGDLSVYGFDGPTTEALAYLDVIPANMGGMGVCHALSSENVCDPGDDDNMRNDENLKFSLAGGEVFTSMELWGNHDEYDADTVWIDAVGDGVLFSQVAVTNNAAGRGVVDLSAIAGLTNMFRVKSFGDQETYVANLTSVPIPAAAWLFGSALIGFASIARKRQAS